MEFNAHKPIYLQICSQLYEQILRGELKADDRILSVRDYGIQLGVSGHHLQQTRHRLFHLRRSQGHRPQANARGVSRKGTARGSEKDETLGHWTR